MNQLASHRNLPARSTTRSGVTLIEVLMSLMIMSIGVSAVAVLFPISMLRSIQATQLTNAAVVKYNVEALLDSKPELIFDPDGDFSPFGDIAEQRESIAEHFRGENTRNYIVDPIGFHTHIADGNTAFATVFGNAGGTPVGVPRFGGGLITANGRKIEGIVGTQYERAATPAEFSALLLTANTMASGSGNWETLVDAVPNGVFPGGIQLPAELDLSDVPTSFGSVPTQGATGYLTVDPQLYRVVVFSTDGTFSESLPILHIDASNRVYFSENLSVAPGVGADQDFNANGVIDLRTLPREFNGGISRVLLQARKVGNYSWMLTVRRRGDGIAQNIDIVVRFANGSTLTDEQVFEATFVEGSRFVGVRTGGLPLPSISAGRFVFDAVNAVWYRVRRVRERSAFGWEFPEYDAVLEVQTAITVPGGEDQFERFDMSGNRILLNGQLDPAEYDFVGPNFVQVKGSEDLTRPGNGDGNLDFGLIMFPTGIVDVYPLGSRQLPTAMRINSF